MRLIFFTFIFISLFSNFLSQVSAHPADEIGIKVYDQAQTLEISPTKAILKIDLTFFAIDKAKLWSSINTDRDQTLSSKEKNDWMKLGQEASWLEIDGKKHEFTATELWIPDFDEFFSAKPINISLAFDAKAKLKPNSTVNYVYKGQDYKLETIKFTLKGLDGANPYDLKPLSPDSYTFKVSEGAGGSQVSGVKASDRLNNFLDTYLKVENASFGLIIGAITISFVIGMLHALTPGHGKAILAGYLVGEKGNILNAVQLGLIITVTHTASVFILGLATLFLTQYVVPSVVISWLSLFSGFLVTAFGAYLLVTRIKELKHGHSHSHKHKNSNLEMSWKNLLPLGISGGLVPCIDALAILIVAISLGKVILGLILLVVFSLGLATALIVAGVVVVVTKQKALKKLSHLKRYEKYISIISAIIVTILGILLLWGTPL